MAKFRNAVSIGLDKVTIFFARGLLKLDEFYRIKDFRNLSDRYQFFIEKCNASDEGARMLRAHTQKSYEGDDYLMFPMSDVVTTIDDAPAAGARSKAEFAKGCVTLFKSDQRRIHSRTKVASSKRQGKKPNVINESKKDRVNAFIKRINAEIRELFNA